MFAPDVSALLMMVPEVEQLHRACMHLSRHDDLPLIPAHITLLYPFRAPDLLNDDLLADLHHLFRSQPAFSYTLTHVARFPQALYLSLDPVQPFVTLIETLVAHYPDCQPYAGKYPDIVPHVTMVFDEEPTFLDGIEAGVVQACAVALPLRLSAREVVLMVRRGGVWAEPIRFALGKKIS